MSMSHVKILKDDPVSNLHLKALNNKEGRVTLYLEGILKIC